MTRVLGVDIGGSGMKAAEVDISIGELVTDRYRVTTPRPSTPDAMARVVSELAAHFDWHGPIGVGFPGVVQDGIVRTAANVDKSWIGVDGDAVFTAASRCDVVLINDADAAGLAEIRFGAGRGVKGVVVMLTLGTGIGSAIFVNGQLVPNTEFGHLVIDGKIAEDRASSRAKDELGLSTKKWANALEVLLLEMERLFTPNLFILGGGISKEFNKFAAYFNKVRTPIRPAEQFNRAGIVGAALAHGI